MDLLLLLNMILLIVLFIYLLPWRGELIERHILIVCLPVKGVRLFRWITLDFKRKFSIQSKPLLLTTLSYNAGKLILILKKYNNDESSSENTQ